MGEVLQKSFYLHNKFFENYFLSFFYLDFVRDDC